MLDTNILVSALPIQLGNPVAIYRAWQEGHFRLLICAEQLDELKATLHKPAIPARIKPYKAGRLVNDLKDLAETIGPLPRIERSPDPTDDFLLALCQAGKADYLVTGDKSGLLSLGRRQGTRIVSPSEFVTLRSSAVDFSRLAAEVCRFESYLGSQLSILELIAISLDSLEGLERFARRLCLFSSTPTWTRTANGFIRPTSIPQTNR